MYIQSISVTDYQRKPFKAANRLELRHLTNVNEVVKGNKELVLNDILYGLYKKDMSISMPDLRGYIYILHKPEQELVSAAILSADNVKTFSTVESIIDEAKQPAGYERIKKIKTEIDLFASLIEGKEAQIPHTKRNSKERVAVETKMKELINQREKLKEEYLTLITE